jgi:hypothetical protein
VGQCSDGFAPTGGLEPSGNRGCIQSFKRDAVADHLNLLYRNIRA